ncbi:tail fiber protein [Comamonas aquatilis]
MHHGAIDGFGTLMADISTSYLAPTMKFHVFLRPRTLVGRAALWAMLGAAPLSNALACGSEDYVGSVCVVAFNWCPSGTLPMQGQTVSVMQYQVLYALLGATYGGDGRTTFGLPDMRGRMPVGTGAGPNLSNVPYGQKDGQESVVLNAANLPRFSANLAGNVTGSLTLPLANTAITGQSITGNVTVNALNGDGSPSSGVNIPSSTSNTVGKTGVSNNFYPPGATKVAVPSSHNLAVSGGTVSGQATGSVNLPVTGTATVGVGPTATVATIPPRQALNFCIVSDGIYPTRP